MQPQKLASIIFEVFNCYAAGIANATTKICKYCFRSAQLLCRRHSKCNHKSLHVLFLKCSIATPPAKQMQTQKIASTVLKVLNCYAPAKQRQTQRFASTVVEVLNSLVKNWPFYTVLNRVQTCSIV